MGGAERREMLEGCEEKEEGGGYTDDLWGGGLSVLPQKLRTSFQKQGWEGGVGWGYTATDRLSVFVCQYRPPPPRPKKGACVKGSAQATQQVRALSHVCGNDD